MTTSRGQDRREAVQREADPIARLRAMVEAMTAGPWAHDPVTGGVGPLCYVEHDGDYRRVDPAQIRPDLDGIAALRNLAPELLAVVDAAERSHAFLAPLRSQGGDSLDQTVDVLTDALDALRARAAEVL